MPTITQYSSGNPAELFYSGPYAQGDQAVSQTPKSFYWAHPSMSGDTPVFTGGVVVEGVGFKYDGALLDSAKKVTSLQVVASHAPADYPVHPIVTFAGLSLSVDDTLAVLQGNAARLRNIIDANSWDYHGSAGNDTFDAGKRSDKLDGSDGSDVLNGAGGNDVVKGGAGIDTLYGGSGDDRLISGSDGDLMFGGAGDDRFYVGSNADRVREDAGEGHDSVFAKDDFFLFPTASIELLSAADTKAFATINLTGNDFSQKIIGNASANRLEGLGGKDVLEGNKGADTLEGGAGKDRLTGGKGSDEFQLQLGDGKDVITDFDATGGGGKQDYLLIAEGMTYAKRSAHGGRDTILDFGDDQTITLLNVKRADFSGADIHHYQM